MRINLYYTNIIFVIPVMYSSIRVCTLINMYQSATKRAFCFKMFNKDVSTPEYFWLKMARTTFNRVSL